MTDQENMKAAVPDAARRYMRYLLIMAGLGGLLYGVDVGVIAAALPYIEQTAGFNPSQLSQVVAAVLFGSVLSSLFAGYLADKLGRKALITVAAALFTVSIPVICLSQEVFGIMLLGRILQGASAGIVGALLGALLGVLLASQLNNLMPIIGAFLDGAALPVAIEPLQVTMIALVAMVLALLSTLYPSWRAAATQPAEALRYE